MIVRVSGVYNVLHDTGETSASFPSIFTMTLGRILAIKLTCVVIATALGSHRMSVLPALREAADASTCHNALTMRRSSIASIPH